MFDWWRKIIRDFNTAPRAVESHNPKPAPVTYNVCEHDWQPASPTSLVLYCTKCRKLNRP